MHCVSLPMMVLGGLAARAARRRQILAPTGLGYGVERGPVAAIVRSIVRRIIGYLLRHPGTVCVFENAEDPCEFDLDPTGPKVVLVGGAGVDPRAFQFGPEPPAPPVKIALLARMIRPKGIAEAVAAGRRARGLGAAVELDLYGAPDPSKRTSYAEADLHQWASEPGIHWHGATDDVGGLSHASRRHVAVGTGRAAEVPGGGSGLAGRSWRPTSPDAERSSVRAAKATWCRPATSRPPQTRWSRSPAIRRCGDV